MKIKDLVQKLKGLNQEKDVLFYKEDDGDGECWMDNVEIYEFMDGSYGLIGK